MRSRTETPTATAAAGGTALALALALGLAAVALAACGSAAPDLFVVDRSGAVPGATLELLVRDDGTVRCNGGRPRLMSAQELLGARQLERDLHAAAARGAVLAPGPGAVFTYSVRTPAGRVRFSDTSPGLVPAFLRLAAFTRAVARGVCGLVR